MLKIEHYLDKLYNTFQEPHDSEFNEHFKTCLSTLFYFERVIYASITSQQQEEGEAKTTAKQYVQTLMFLQKWILQVCWLFFRLLTN